MRAARLPFTLASPSDAPLLVWVLAPLVETQDEGIAWYSDYTQSRAEYARAFEDLGLEWRWQPITLREHLRTIELIIAESNALGREPVIINLCDGDETNGSPGLSVIRALDAAGLRYTGADAAFYDVTTSKIDMKAAFDRAGVPTSPWEVLARVAPRRGVFDRVGRTLILKPAISAGSMGITTKSVVRTPQALVAQMRRLEKGYHGWDLASGGVIAERFIDGPEFTTFIVGHHTDRESAIIYAPVERAFNETLPPEERFLSFDRLWGMYETETPLPNEADLWQYRKAPQKLHRRLREVSWQAYAACGGRGYGRVDLRQDRETGEIHVLEVNAQCGLSEDEAYTSIGAILRFARTPFSHLVREIIALAIRPEASPVAVPAIDPAAKRRARAIA
jgi:D-alanine-D-alanine ligase